MSRTFQDLERGVVLAELGGHGDGPYCAKHAADAALAMMGTYIVDPGDDVPYPEDFVFKPDRSGYLPYLREHIAAGRSGGAKIGVSVATVELAHTLAFLAAAEAAGADYASLCAHSTMDMFVSERLGEELCRRKNAQLLEEWAAAILGAMTIPVIFKIGLTDPEDTLGAVDILADKGVPIVHINLEETHTGSEGLRFLEQLTGRCQCLIAGGGIRNLEDARRVLDTGANAVAIGTAAMEDPGLCGSIQEALRSGETP
ncbi:MAG: HisA/HisF-related TIM barrel protein [Candidatus Latescibacteria bacterium]|jgi:tRNA-dihydrouridine synthase|nr:HisA/HisF-related TIM barrel protein [Candidatus Latescibacterota bacterium]